MLIPGRKTILLALAALVALLVAGCGGGGEETETSTPTVEEPTALTKEDLIEQGDGICAEVNAAVGALASSEGSEESASEDSEKVANLYTGMVERLQDLGTPEGDEGDYASFMEAAEELAKEGIEVEVLDLRTILPLDEEAILATAKKTSKVIVMHEATMTGGPGGEVVARIAQKAFEYLDGPIVRIAPPDTPVPYSPPLEEAFLPQVKDIVATARKLAAY